MSLFSSVSAPRLKKNKFNLSHDNMLACEHGQIIPCYVQENILPGSHLKINQATLMRYQALLAPLQHHVNAFIHFWWIPTRLIDKEFPSFISGENMRDSLTYNPPYFTYSGLKNYISGQSLDINDFVKSGTLLDFLGYPIPNAVTDWSKLTEKMSIKRFQYYLMPIYYKYLNENLTISNDLKEMFECLIEQKEVNYPIHGNVSYVIGVLLKTLKTLNTSCCFPHAWQKDYFTSALPFVQLGDPVTLPFGTSAPVTITAETPVASAVTTLSGGSVIPNIASGTVTDSYVRANNTTEGGITTLQVEEQPSLNRIPLNIDYTSPTASTNVTISPLEIEGEADLSEATAITINELRIANALQSLKEAYARFGTRFNEWLEGFWGVTPDDATLQMPKWLGGGKVPVNIADIEQNSATLSTSLKQSTSPLGTLAGKGTGFGTFKAVNAYFKEPGCVIGFLFVQPKPVYGNQGLNRFITKLDNIYDYFNPKTEHLGEQAVLAQELYYDDDQHNTDTFGYQSRYAEYKFMPSEVHGQFMNYLNFWHMARIFTERPTLSPEFIYTQLADTKRPFAVQSIDGVDISSCLFWMHFEVEYIAPMSRFGTPMLLN